MEIEPFELLQWTLNVFLEAGGCEAKLHDILQRLDPLPEDFTATLDRWQAEGYIEIIRPIQHCKHKDVCFRMLKPFPLANE